MLKFTNHICFPVRNLNDSVHFYGGILLEKLLLAGKKTAYSELTGPWIALNEEEDIPRNEIHPSHTHTAFTIGNGEFKYWHQRLRDNSMNILEGRIRGIKDRRPIYFTNPDGHKLELYTGTLENRLNCYKEVEPHMTFYK